MSEGNTTTCRHVDCGKRFTLSRYGNRTHTSSKTRKRHQFCCDAHRKAHSRRLKRLEAQEGERTGGVTCGVTELGGTIPKGERTQAKTELKSPCKTGTSEVPLTPKITTEQPHSGRPSRHPKAIPDATYPNMWRVQWPDGRLSDLANISRINDAIAAYIETQRSRQPQSTDNQNLTKETHV